MAKGEQRGNREAKKPKKEKLKTIAAAASQKGTVSSIRDGQEVAARSAQLTRAAATAGALNA